VPAKYIRLASQLKELISQNGGNGVYKLPSEHALCLQYHVSRQTVRSALQLLAREGLIEKRQGSGSFSTGSPVTQAPVGVIVNHAEEYTSPALLGDIRSVLREQGCRMQVFSTCYQTSVERAVLQSLEDTPLRGLIVEGTKTALPSPNTDLYARFRAKEIPLLFLGGCYPNLPMPCIKEDNYYGGYMLAKHLIQKGHKKIAGIFRADDVRGLERYYGFVCALRDFDIPFSDDQILLFSSSQLLSLEAKSDTSFLTAFLHRDRQLSAAVCQSDEIAYWLIRELRYANVRVPEDMSVVSFDNSYMSDLGSVHITTLAHKEQRPGVSAARAMLNMIRRMPFSSEELSWYLIPKGSDAPFEE